MSLKEKISQDFKAAFKNKETFKKNVLSLLNSEIKNEEIKEGSREAGISDEKVLAIIKRAARQRKDSIEQFEKGGRPELAKDEKTELEILQVYLPEEMGDDELEENVREIAENIGAKNVSDIGKLMGAVMAKLKNRADGAKVREVAQKILS